MAVRSRRSRRLSIALLVGLLFGGVAACSTVRHKAGGPGVDIGDSASTRTDSVRVVGPGPRPAFGANAGITLREVLGENASSPVSPTAAALEDQFFALTNAARAAVNVARVERDPDLEAYARVHVRLMAQNGRLYHSNIQSLLGPWWMIGENVGTGPDAPAIQAAYEHSPSHYDNIIDPAFKYVGVGVVVGPGGRIYTAQDYGI